MKFSSNKCRIIPTFVGLLNKVEIVNEIVE